MPADAHARGVEASSTTETSFQQRPDWLGTPPDEEREELFYGKLTVWSCDDPDTLIESEPWGTATDVAAAVIEAIENEEVGGFVIAMARGVPDDVRINPRVSDPRGD